MSKTTLAIRRLGGAGSSECASFANALAIIPISVAIGLRANIFGKFIYVQADCAEHKQVRAIAGKSEKLVHGVISAYGGKLNVC